ncbi:MAG: CocE/NonD family hydrolase, partial [Smithella sp.]|nr:CocE/NonD family hydrolase [Smithella sp.]
MKKTCLMRSMEESFSKLALRAKRNKFIPQTHRFKIFVIFLTLIAGMMITPAASQAIILDDSVKVKMQDALVKLGVADLKIDFNIQIPMTQVENPVGYDCNIYASAFYHTSPYDGTGSARRPTILVATGYRRDIIGLLTSILAFVPKDYNVVVMDMRGTGSGEGIWSPLDPIEQYDVAYMIDKWIPAQPWSDGTVGMVGGSYMGIIQYLAAGLIEQENGTPKHLKAIAPMSAYNDVFKDIVMHGGNFDVEFMAIWIVLTDLISVLPPDLILGGVTEPGFNKTDFMHALSIWGQHFNQLTVPLEWISDPAMETRNPWFDKRSPMLYWPDKPAGGWDLGPDMPEAVGGNVLPQNLPVFTATGWFDIFTRGSFMNYEYGLKNHAATDKAMIVGPWYHIDAAFMYPGVKGMGLEGQFKWDVLVRWMDWRLKGKNDPFLQQFPVLLYVMGEERWRAEKAWPLPASRLQNKTYYLSKAKPSLIFGDWFGVINAVNNYKLVPSVSTTDYNNVFLGIKKPKPNPVLYHHPLALNGMSSRSAQRWLGFSPLTMISQISKYTLGKDMDAQLFWEDERNDETGVLTFTTDPLTSDMEISGPLKLSFWAKTKFTNPLSQAALDKFIVQIKASFNIGDDKDMILRMTDRKDVQWVIEVNDVFPNGRARNITSGWLGAMFRPYNPANPTQVDPAYKAFDPFYFASDTNPSPIAADTVYQYVVELWPTTNVFKKGHRIRVS